MPSLPCPRRARSRVRSVSSYLLWVNSLITISLYNMYNIFNQLLTLMVGVLTLTFSQMNSPGAVGYSAGFSLGTILADNFVSMLVNLIFAAVGCSGMSPPSEEWPSGRPTGCDLFELDKILTFQGCLIMKWGFILICAKLGQRLIKLSIAFVGTRAPPSSTASVGGTPCLL